MKKSFIACFIACAMAFIFSAETASAQAVNVAWGPVLKEAKKTYTSKIIGNDNKGFYTLRTDYSDVGIFNPTGTKLMLERYDLQSKLVFSKELIIPAPKETKDKFRFEDIFYLNGQLVIFSSYFNKDKDKNIAFANKISADGVVENKMVEISSIPEATKRNSGGFSFSLSNDSTKILVFNFLPFEKKENQKFQFRVIDQELTTVFSKNVTLKELDKEVSLSNYQVDNQGNVYVLMTTDKSRGEKSSKEQGFTYRVNGYFVSGEAKEYQISLPNKFVTDITFNVDKNLNLIVAGFYAEDKKLKTDGTFFMKVDFETKKVLAQGAKKFSTEFMELFMSKTQAKKDNAGVTNMSLDELIIREDGGALLIAEQAYSYVVESRTGNGAVSRTYHYVNNDIVFVNINPDGSIQWISRVPKKQHTVNDGGNYSSYSYSIQKDKIYLIYNDNIKNIAEPDPKKYDVMKNPGKSVTMMVTVDNTGKFKRTALFPAKEQKTIVRPSFYFQGSDSIIIFSETGRDYRYGNIKFN